MSVMATSAKCHTKIPTLIVSPARGTGTSLPINHHNTTMTMETTARGMASGRHSSAVYRKRFILSLPFVVGELISQVLTYKHSDEVFKGNNTVFYISQAVEMGEANVAIRYTVDYSIKTLGF